MISTLVNHTIPLSSTVIEEVAIPFGSMFKLAFKWQMASFLAFWLLFALLVLVGATLGILFGLSLAGIMGALAHAVKA
jgi:hypothetical protein